MSNGPKNKRPCNGCGKLCSLGMISKVSAWLCWECA